MKNYKQLEIIISKIIRFQLGGPVIKYKVHHETCSILRKRVGEKEKWHKLKRIDHFMRTTNTSQVFF